MKKLGLLFCVILFSSIQLSAQFKMFEKDSTIQECSHRSLDLTIRNNGISFGNSPTINGIRFNISDCGIKKINGINFTFWKPGQNPGSEVNGFSFGLAPNADKLNGLSVGIIAVVAEESMNGINFGILADVSQGNINGINIGGLACVAQRNISGINVGGFALVAQQNISGFNFGSFTLVTQGGLTGINISGLASVAQNEIMGINFGGLALVSQSNIYGFNFSGLASVAQGNIYGLNFGGLALVSQESIFGINTGGLALVAQKEINGINLGGIALVAQDGIMGINIAGLALVGGQEHLKGINVTLGKSYAKAQILGVNFAAYNTETRNLMGINITPGWVKTENLTGFSVSSYHKITGLQTGLVIGIINIADALKGIQLGLLNIVKDNPVPFKVLPVVNFNF